MAGVSFSELILLFVIGLLILGPERLPRVASQIGRWVGRARRTANQLRYQLEREIALSDIEANKKKNPPKTTASKPADSERGAAKSQQSADAGPQPPNSEPVASEPAAGATAPESAPADTAGADEPNSPGEKREASPSSASAGSAHDRSEQT